MSPDALVMFAVGLYVIGMLTGFYLGLRFAGRAFGRALKREVKAERLSRDEALRVSDLRSVE